jgi:hypothetical protein
MELASIKAFIYNNNLNKNNNIKNKISAACLHITGMVHNAV